MKLMTAKQATALVQLNPNAPVRIFTRQHISILSLLQDKGYITCSPGFAGRGAFRSATPTSEDIGDLFPYEWMREQMARHS